jgi:hypothetical protein
MSKTWNETIALNEEKLGMPTAKQDSGEALL